MYTKKNPLMKKILNHSVIKWQVFLPSVALIILFVLYGALFPERSAKLFSTLQSDVVQHFGWFYLVSVIVFVLFCFMLILSRYGDIKLGLDHEVPEYTFKAWFAMLFSAGMGIGIIFYGVAEPIMHYVKPPIEQGLTDHAAEQAMAITFFHWGVHAWAIYAVVGLSLAYFSFRHNLPLTIRSTLYPLFGNKIYGPAGHTVDTFAVLGTPFGVATSLGLGVLQINAGLDHLFSIGQSLNIQLILIAFITLLATISVVLGLDGGIKRLSELNLYLAVGLMLFVLIVGNTVHLLDSYIQNIGVYLNNVVDRSFNLYAYRDAGSWLSSWTLFYWGWWIAWSPFVGMFIARISRGRTIREFLVGVLFVPVAFTFLWMTVLGNTALSLEMQDPGSISQIVQSNLPLSLYAMLEQLPWSQISSLIATLLVVTFFVTSADSGSLVIDTITSGGREHKFTWQRVFWSLLLGLVAAILLTTGGLSALQTAPIVSAFPFVIIMLIMAYSLMISLHEESVRMDLRTIPTTPILDNMNLSWQARLHAITAYATKNDAQIFLQNKVLPVFKQIREELEEMKHTVIIKRNKKDLTLIVDYGDEHDFHYAVHIVSYDAHDIDSPHDLNEKDGNINYFRAEVYLMEGGQDYDILGYSSEQIMNDILKQYDKHMHFLHGIR